MSISSFNMSTLTTLAYYTVSSAISFVALNVSQKYRSVLLTPLAICAVKAFRGLGTFSSSTEINSLWGLFVIIWSTHICSVLYLERYVLPKEDAAARWDFKAAYKMWSNVRWINTTKTGVSADCEDRAPDSGKQHEPALADVRRRSFLTRRLSSSCKLFFLYGILQRCFPGPFEPLTLDDFAPEREVYLRRLMSGTITRRETLLRSVVAMQWIWLVSITLCGIHDLLAVFFVIIARLDEPEDWPPYYGSPLEAYTIRRFWGKFWHRAVYRCYTAYARIIVHRFLWIKPASSLDRILINFCIFLFSGIAHALVSWQMGLKRGVWQDVAWFCANYLAIMVERLFQSCVERLPLSPSIKSIPALRVLSRIMGYIWVFMFFFWSVPKWQYPKVYCGGPLY